MKMILTIVLYCNRERTVCQSHKHIFQVIRDISMERRSNLFSLPPLIILITKKHGPTLYASGPCLLIQANRLSDRPTTM